MERLERKKNQKKGGDTMGSHEKTSCYEKEYRPKLQKTFETAVMSFLEKEFPHLTGPLTRKTFVDVLKEIVEQFYPPISNLKAGQLLWIAVAKDEKTQYGKKMSSTRLVPVILTVIDQSDIQIRMEGARAYTFRTKVIARLLREADNQGGTLSETDLALILQTHHAHISQMITRYEEEHDTILPRRGNVHDMGPTVSHKKKIVKKIKIDGKSSSEVARETNHSLGSVDRYALDFERINFCLKKGLSVDGTSHVTSLSKRLVLEYIGIINDFNKLKKDQEDKEFDELLDNPPF